MESFILKVGWLYSCLVVFTLLMDQLNSLAGAQGVGLNYGMLGDNLPTPDMVVGLLKSRNIQRVRLFDPNPNALKALEGSGIEVVLGTLNGDLQRLGSDLNFVAAWVAANVIPHAATMNFRYITVGNEIIPSDLAVYVLPAMKNLDAALKATNLVIPVSTVVHPVVLGVSFPPSQGAFSDTAGPALIPIVEFLEANDYPLLLNAYSYYSYDPKTVRLDYALFTATEVVVWDGTLGYKNLFDAIIDTVYSALEKAGGPTVGIVVTESGWPSDGNGDIATVVNAQTYNNNLIAHVLQGGGTPKRPGMAIETYVFAIFNEDMKEVGTEQHFGLYYPNMTEVYHTNFSQ